MCSILGTILIMAEEQNSYDGELSIYLSNDKVTRKALTDLCDIDMGLSKFNPKLLAINSLCLDFTSIRRSENGFNVGYFVISNRVSGGHPIMRIFTDGDNGDAGAHLKKNTFSYQLNTIKCNTLDLYDSRARSANINSLCNIRTLTHLGLPRSNMVFDGPFRFPESIETIIVRNAVLNKHFFSALNQSKSLKSIVILNCSTDIDMPESENVKDGRLAYFDGFSGRAKKMKIIDSDPTILNLMLLSEWNNLQELQVTLYNDNLLSVSEVFSNESQMSSVFPKLSRLKIREYGAKNLLLENNTNKYKLSKF